MAKHISILNRNKRCKKIETSIRNAFNKGLNFVRGSFKFEPLDDMYKEHPDDVVFTTIRAIPYDRWVYKSDRGCFEVHYNRKTKEVTQIYLVA